jgi:hypothetical protein
LPPKSSSQNEIAAKHPLFKVVDAAATGFLGQQSAQQDTTQAFYVSNCLMLKACSTLLL